MFEKWFGTRKPHSSERSYSFRPQLEYLEGRLAPSAVMAMDKDHGPPGPPPGHGGPPPGHVNQHNNNNDNVHINAHDSFNTNITDSFNTAINNIIVNQFFTGGGGSSQALGGLLGLAAQQNFSALIGLVTDELALAQDTLFALEGGLAGMNSNLAGLMHGLQNGIMNNPLEGSPVGELVGMMVFNTAINQTVNVTNSPGATVTVIA
ncbi:MAG TPA: hypothetical protein VH575_31755 [Gemmataceae bacterium]